MLKPVIYILLALMAGPTCFGQVIGSEKISAYVPVTRFNAKRDAVADISAAIAEAQRTGKRIILYIGGPWCPYCDQLEELFEKHSGLRTLRDAHFITVPIYIGSDNSNAHALASYTAISGVPHFFVLDKNGALLHSQHMLELRANGEYGPSKMQEFLSRWAKAEDIPSAKVKAAMMTGR
jgi:thioredoxin-related protein